MTDFMRVNLEIVRKVKPTSLRDLSDLLKDLGLASSAQEQVWVIALDGINQVRSITTVATGTYHDCFVAIPAIISPVLMSASDRFILAHNHPNGRTKPTKDDIELTARVEAAAKTLDMSFDDHLIVGPDGNYSSMAELGFV